MQESVAEHKVMVFFNQHKMIRGLVFIFVPLDSSVVRPAPVNVQPAGGAP